MYRKILIIITMLLTASAILFAEESNDMRITDREIIERLHNIDIRITRVEEGLKALNQRMDTLQDLMWVLLAGMFVLVGFVIWDRRTALSPVIKKTNELEKRDEKLLEALKEYAKVTPKLASILKSFGLL